MNELYVVGIGPGDPSLMTGEADAALKRADVIAGYRLYVDLVRDAYPGREFLTTGMRGEVERCRMAIDSAKSGKRTAVVCSGDSGVYGMAGLILEMTEHEPDVEVTVIPGVTAALSGSAVLGAPLGHDFAVISLSDLLTPWETIEKRLRAAAQGDFIICLYNPASHHRKDYLKRACGILLETLPENRVAGYVRQIGRDGQEKQIMTLGELKEHEADMLMTVFIGNSSTRRIGEHMVTPRGYHL